MKYKILVEYRKYVWAIMFLSLVFFPDISNPAHALVFIQQLNSASTTNDFHTQTFNLGSSTLTADSSTLKYFTFYVDRVSVGSSCYFGDRHPASINDTKFEEFLNANYTSSTYAVSTNGGTGNTFSDSGQPVSNSQAPRIVGFTIGNYPITAGRFYQMTLDCDAAGGGNPAQTTALKSNSASSTQPYFILSDSSTSSFNYTYDFLFPLNNTSSPDFSQYVFDTSEFSGDPIQAYFIRTTLIKNDPSPVIIANDSGGFIGSAGDTFVFAKTVSLINGEYTLFSAVTNSIGQELFSPSGITFTIDNAITSYPLNTSGKELAAPFGQGVVSPLLYNTSSTEQYCQPAANFLDVGGGIAYGFCASWNMIKNTIDVVSSKIPAVVSSTKKIFPYSIYVEVNSIIDTAETTASQYYDNSIILGDGSPDVFMGRKYIIYTSSTLAVVGDAIGLDFRDIFSKILYLMVGIVIITESIVVIRHIKNSTSAQ